MDDRAQETTGYLQGPNGWLYGCFHAAPAPTDCACLTIAPFGEERKCAYRLIVEVSRALAARLPVMRFDLSGTGESTGSHADATLTRWLADAAVALGQLRQSAPEARRFWLLGARLGANLALRFAATEPAVAGLLLWEPLLTGEDFLNEMIRRKQIKEMMGGGQASSLADEQQRQWDRGEAVDFDGFPVNAALANELRNLNLVKDLGLVGQRRALLAHVTGAKTLSGPWGEIETSFQGASHRFVIVRQKPFWGLLDYQESKELRDETMAFVSPMAG